MIKKMTIRQQKFCDEYLINCNATQSAINAGYSKKSAYSIGEQNLKKPEIRAYIGKRLEEIKADNIADATEVIEFLTSVMRGESTASVVVVEGMGDGCSKAKVINKPPDEKERLKAAELLGKRHGIFTDKLDVTSAIPIVICEDLEDEGE